MRFSERFLVVIVFITVSFNVLSAAGFSIDANKFKSSPFGDGFFTVYGGEGLDKGYLGINFLMHYQPESIVTFDSDGNKISSVIKNQFLSDLSFSYSPAKWFDIGFVLPIIIYQNGDGWNKNDSVPSGGIGDIRLVPRFQIANVSNGLFALSIIPEITAPTGRQIHSALGSALFTFKPVISLGSESKWIGFATNLFYQILQKQTYVKSVFDDEFGVKVALNVHAVPQLLDLIAEFNASTSIADPFKNEAVDNIEFGGGLKIKTPVDLDVSAGAYGGFGNAVGIPVFRVFLGISWSMNVFPEKQAIIPPAQKVENKDADKKEEAKKEPEIKTEPVPEKTDDKIKPDKENIKSEPKQEVKVESKPDPKTESVKRVPIKPAPVKSGEKLSTIVNFMQESDYIADAVQIEKVAMILTRNYTLNLRLEAHNDVSEKNVYSKKRAEAVKAVLVKNGVEPGRIRIKIIGAAEPLSKGDTDIDKEKNRRVEFFIVTD